LKVLQILNNINQNINYFHLLKLKVNLASSLHDLNVMRFIFYFFGSLIVCLTHFPLLNVDFHELDNRIWSIMDNISFS